jgi:polyphosphate kinase
VKIQLIIRGICCLVPGVEGVSANIGAISIVDKYLEHARVFIFGNGGEEKIYLSSADLMTRNLDHRLEVGFPVLDPGIRKEIRDIINIQLNDTTKARVIDGGNTNRYRKDKGKISNQAQPDIYTYLKYKR